MFCIHCGKQLEDGSRFCKFCGKPLAAQPAAEPAAPAPEIPAASPSAEPVSIPFDPQVDIYPDLPPVSEPPAEPAPIPYDANIYSDSVAPKPTKKKGKKTGLIVAIILVLVLLIGGCVGFYLYTQHVYEENMAAYDAAEILLKKGDYDGALEAFRDLGDFEDAADRAEELEALQEDYDEALELMEEGSYSEAYDAFQELGDYRDSETLMEYEIAYRQALDTMASAAEGDPMEFAYEQYIIAAGQFAALGDYADSADRASDCYLQFSLVMLELGDYDRALGYQDMMNPADVSTLQAAYADLCADGAFIRDLKEAMLTWYDEYGYYNRSDELSLAWDMMAPYENAYFNDPSLEDRLADFQYALQVMYNSLDSEDTIGVWSEYYLGEYFLFTLADQMYNEYGMFADDPTNREIFVGVSELYYAYSVMEYSFECWWEDSASADQMDDGHYYATYTNDTGYSFDLYATIYFYAENGDLVEIGDEMVIYVARGATVYIPTIPTTISDDDWYTWNMYWDFGNVS